MTQVKFPFHLPFLCTQCRCSLFSVQWLSSFFFVLFFLGPITLTIALRDKRQAISFISIRLVHWCSKSSYTVCCYKFAG